MTQVVGLQIMRRKHQRIHTCGLCNTIRVVVAFQLSFIIVLNLRILQRRCKPLPSANAV